MNKAKKVYIDKDGNMCRQKERHECKEVEPFTIKGKLKLVQIALQRERIEELATENLKELLF